MIPKIIHYCWFGKNKKSREILECINSWKQIMPEYKIIEWNENNYKSYSFFFNENLRNKKYAFASDYARIDILNKYGGIYLDTDMLFFKKLDVFLGNQMFFGLESSDYVSCGVIGSMHNSFILNRILFEFDQITDYEFFKGYTIVNVITKLFIELGYEIKSGNHEGVMFCPIDFFYSYSYYSTNSPYDTLTENSYAIHLWNASWLTNIAKVKHTMNKKQFKKAWIYFLKALLNSPQNLKLLPYMIKETWK